MSECAHLAYAALSNHRVPVVLDDSAVRSLTVSTVR